MLNIEREAKQWMKEKQLSTITAAMYQEKACETAIFPKRQAMEYLTPDSYTHLTQPTTPYE